MFGLSFEKLLLVALVAGVVVGPQRLPVYAHRLGEAVRALRTLVETHRTQVADETGVPLRRADWEALDLRRYDPREIVRTALTEPSAPPPTRVAEHDRAALLEEASRVRPGQQWLVTGDAAHPRRVLIASLAADDPRRVAAQDLPVAAES